jgi:hypothetical protein
MMTGQNAGFSFIYADPMPVYGFANAGFFLALGFFDLLMGGGQPGSYCLDNSRKSVAGARG